MGEFAYGGSELETFAHAVNWKRYWSGLLLPFFGKDVVEVGSGIGANTVVLAPHHAGRWTSLEPDRALLEEARRRLRCAGLEDCCALECGTLRTLDASHTFDTVL